MMPVIRISDEVMDILKKFAVPLEDTPDSVLRRILSDYMKLKNHLKNVPTEDKFLGTQLKSPDREIPVAREKETRWIIASLKFIGRSARAEEVTNHIKKVFGNEFNEREKEPIPSTGEPRWHKNVNWARYYMTKAGLLREDSPRGVWDLTEKGENYYSD